MNRLFHCSLATCFVMLVGMALTAKAADVPVFVFAGQSNAVGVNILSELTPAQQTAQPNVLFYGPNETGNTWGALTPSTNSPNLTDSLGWTGLGS